MKSFKLFFIALLFLAGCAMFKTQQQKISYCPVCGMKVDLSEAYKWKYERDNFYFDSYNCREAFKMNPEKFIKKNTTEKK